MPSSDIKSTNTKNTTSTDDAVIQLLSAPIYREFFTILESAYANIDVL